MRSTPRWSAKLWGGGPDGEEVQAQAQAETSPEAVLMAARKKAAKKKAVAKKRASKKGVASSIRTIEAAEETCTARQVAFAYEYIASPKLNGSAAARAIGVSPESASTQAAKWLANRKVAKLIAELKRQRAERVLLTADDVLRELAYICQSNITDLIIQKEGVWRLGDIGDLKDLPASVQKSILEIKQVEKYDTFGNPIIETTLKLHPKVAALGLAGKHVDVGAFADDEKGGAVPVTLVIESGLGAPPGSRTKPDAA